MERSDRQNKVNAFRLTQRIRVNHKHHKQYYCVTFTPKEKNKSHVTLLQEIIVAVKRYKVILDVFLIAESENTNHFHGVIVTKDVCKFSRLFNKNNTFHFHNSGQIPLNDWCTYINKTLPTQLYVLHREITFFSNVEYFNKPFITDTQLAHYEP